MSERATHNRRPRGSWVTGLDHGWPWLLAGLVLLVSAGVFPSEERLEAERASVETLRTQRVHALETVDAYESFLEGIDAGDETVVRRLAAAQLGIMPRGHKLLTMLTGIQEPPTRWIERSVLDEMALNPLAPAREPVVNDSLLATILSGEGRVWLFGGAILAIFIGLLLDRGDRTSSEPASISADSGL